MRIVTDSGADISLSAEEQAVLDINVVPLTFTLDGQTYHEGLDITPPEFYPLLEKSRSMPVTSQPSVGNIADTYRRLAADDPDILSIHISSGLSGTFNAARTAATMVPEANVTHFDAKTLSAVVGWQVEAAARAIRAGWAKDKILALIRRIGDASESIYTLNELKYLIHGGRISHLQGIVASLLNIKPLIGVEKVGGTYVQLGRTRSFGQAVRGLVDIIARRHAPGSALRTQVLHSFNPEGARQLRQLVGQRFKCSWLPLGFMSLVLGAHTGSSMVGVAYAPAEVFADIP
jgi:DegV family protein with EDD domain